MNVTHSAVTIRRYEFKVQDYGHGCVVADVQAAIAWATSKYKEVHGKASTFDDWLRVRGDEEGLTFWFEVRDGTEPGS